MSEKKVIFNAEDFGCSKELNQAVLKGHLNGFLTSASICANGKSFDSAVYEIVPECPNLGIGVHLNLTSGNSLLDGEAFRHSFSKLLIRSNDKKVQQKVEEEFRLQIEKVLKFTKVTHIDSHDYVHTIPSFFKIASKLAKEYDIKFLTTYFENFYCLGDLKKNVNFRYPCNVFKACLLNILSSQNKEEINRAELKTNDFLIGTEYKNLMDEKTVVAGLQKLPNEDCTTEIILHPHYYSFPEKNNKNYKEYLVTLNKDLQDKIRRLGFTICNYR